MDNGEKKKEILPLLIEEGTNEPQKLDLMPLLAELKYVYFEEHEQPAGHPQGEQAGYWVENHRPKGN